MTLLDHLVADLLQFARGRMGNLLAAALVVVLGLHFTLLGASDHREFLSFTYVYLPTLFLTIAALTVSWERHTRFSDLVLVSPLTRSAYYWSKLLGAMTLGVCYVLATLPFALLFAWMAGWSWLPVVGHHVALSLVVVVATSCLGVFLSVLFTHRGFLPATFTGFALAALFTQWEFLIRIVRNVVHPDQHGAFLRLLVASPAYVAANASPYFRVLDAPSPASLVVSSLALSAFLALLGHVAFTRLQSAETWDARPAVLAGFVAFAGVAAVALAAVFPTGDLADPESPATLRGSFIDPETGIGFSIDPRVWGKSVDGAPAVRAVLREPTADPWVVRFARADDRPYTLHNVTLTLRSEDWLLDETTFRFGTIHVPANGDPTPPEGETWHLVPALSATPVRMDAAYAVGKSWFHYTLSSDEGTWSSDQYVPVRPAVSHPYLYPVFATLLLALTIRVAWWRGGWER